MTLPALKPHDADLTWTIAYQYPSTMITKVSDSGPLAADSTATFRYQTLPEPADVASGTEQTDGIAHVTASVHRKDLDDLHMKLTDYLFAQVPALIANTIGPALRAVIAPKIQAMLQPLATIRDITVIGVVPVNYHTRDDNTSAAPTGQLSPNTKKLVLPTGCPDAAVARFDYHEPSQDIRDEGFVCYYVRNDTVMQLGVGVLSRVLNISEQPGAEPLAVPGADAAWIAEDCDTTSGKCYTVRVVVGKATLQVGGGTSHDETIAIAKAVLGIG